MRKEALYVIGAVLFLGAAFGSCEKDLLYANFSINRSAEFEIPAVPPIDLPERNDSMSLEGDQQFQANDTRMDQVEEIEADEVSFHILAPDDRTFDFLEEVKLYIETENAPRKLVAERTDIPAGIGQRLEMNTKESVNLAPYAKEKSFRIVYAGKTDKATDSETKLEVKFRFDVKAKVIE